MGPLSSCELDHVRPVGPESKCRAKQCRGVNYKAAKAEYSYFARCYPDRISAWRDVIFLALSAVAAIAGAVPLLSFSARPPAARQWDLPAKIRTRKQEKCQCPRVLVDAKPQRLRRPSKQSR